MCTVCGCGEAHLKLDDVGAHHINDRKDAALNFGANAAQATIPGLTDTRILEIEQGVLDRNGAYAAANRQMLLNLGVLALNLVSSPGSGKTTLLCRTIELLNDESIAVIEGDQQTSNDAARIRATGAQAIQINTGKGCHLDGHMVGHALEKLSLDPNSILFVENVGNLVCPAAFDLGEACKVAVLSVTEGEDKPLKYPDMFTAARLALLNKTDLAPYCDVDLDLFETNLRRVNPEIEILRLSAKTGEGMSSWIDWLKSERVVVSQRDGAEQMIHQTPQPFEAKRS